MYRCSVHSLKKLETKDVGNEMAICGPYRGPVGIDVQKTVQISVSELRHKDH